MNEVIRMNTELLLKLKDKLLEIEEEDLDNDQQEAETDWLDCWQQSDIEEKALGQSWPSFFF